MTNIDESTFDKLGLSFVDPSYWMDEGQPLELAKLLVQFLSLWFRHL